MEKVIVASRNPVKIEAVSQAFHRMFPERDFEVVGLSVDSGVPDQPLNDGMCWQGAVNRAEQVRQRQPEAGFWVGIEGGVDVLYGKMIAFAWIVILTQDDQGSARTAIFQLPREVQSLVEAGLELGDADDRVFGRENSKQNSGAVGLLTGDVVTRTSLYEQAVILALVAFKNPALYGPSG
jgi:inosine/xanthosine triphosphatase